MKVELRVYINNIYEQFTSHSPQITFKKANVNYT